ncbi:MAG: dihydrofolate reductase family protein [Candidatus Thiodiazotropha sp. (ex Lucinoma borealis)]|nr:dihydrofolate reductase family protein [Candidatus Thiodiazotropha sp. (ex Lucinoma borealis)]MCU7855923.1 dihydrofolate reductase family protein [Candidatus Thiodiazotropha sp. (ex Lucinoma borealis)]
MIITYYVASSLDGYIAKEDGDVSWLDDLGIDLEESGYEAFFSTVDALVMGRNTFDVINGFGAWPYGEKPIWVCTANTLDVIEGCNLQNGRTPADTYQEAQDKGIEHLWLVGGGKLASSFLEENLLTHLSISQMPIILGGGIKLFDELQSPIKIHSISAQPQKSGFSQLDFVVTLD